MSDSVRTTGASSKCTATEVLIIGSGFSGVAAAVALTDIGYSDIVLLERASALGGTWRDNDYPGCACDVPSRLYSLSFAPNHEWTRSFSEQAEIRAYLEAVAERTGVTPRIRFNQCVRGARWDATTHRWCIDTDTHRFSAPMLIMATGALSDPVVPEIPGQASFQGAAFHSSRWAHDVPLDGARVAVVGTGASAIQFVPSIQPRVQSLTLLQRTPAWLLPRYDRTYSAPERAAFRHVPGFERFARGLIYSARELLVLAFKQPSLARVVQRLATAHLHAQVQDPALRAALTPDYTLGCKRVLVSNTFYPAVAQPNVRLVTSAVREIVPDGVLTADGAHHAADVLVYGTGFRPTNPPLAPHVIGREQRSLADVWNGSMHAYAGTSVHGFPNLFIVPGPGTGLGHTSQLYMIESQLAHITSTLQYMRRHQADTVEPTLSAQEAWVREVDERMQRTVWMAGGCRSWYRDATGRVSMQWPDFTFRFRQRVRHFRPSDHLLTPKPVA